MKDYVVKLEVFEGPFDLLLSLIEKEQVDIYSVSLAKITSQYLEYLKTAEQLQLELAGEFLVMAAVLLKLKSKKLLPASEEMQDEDDDFFKDESELLDRLVEYKLFKQLAEQLQERGDVFEKVFFRGNENVNLNEQFLLKDVSVTDLTKLFTRAWQTSMLNQEIQALYVEEISVDEKKNQILEKIKAQPDGFNFFEIFERGCNRFEIVAGFLAILELVRQKLIRFKQEVPFGPIFIGANAGENFKEAAN